MQMFFMVYPILGVGGMCGPSHMYLGGDGRGMASILASRFPEVGPSRLGQVVPSRLGDSLDVF